MDERFRVRVFVDYCQYIIGDVGAGVMVMPHPTSNGIINVAPGGACVLTGLHTGEIQLEVEIWDRQPPLDLDPWDDVVEVSYESSAGEVAVTGLMSDGPEGLPNLVNGPGEYRFRIHVRDRDAVGWDSGIGWPGTHAPPVGPDGTWPTEKDDVPIEQHLLQVWPASRTPEILYKATDLVGAHRRG